MFLIVGHRRNTDPIGEVRRRCDRCHLVSSQGVDKTCTRLTLFFVPLFPLGGSDFTTVCYKCGHRAALPYNPMKWRKDEGGQAALPPSSLAGTRWLFQATETTVEFLADGKAQFGTTGAGPHWTQNGNVLGQWKQNGEALCSSATVGRNGRSA